MPRFPYFNLPFPYYRTQYVYPNYNSYSKAVNKNYSKNPPSSNTLNNELTYTENDSENSSNNRFYTKKNKSNSNNSNYLFDLFGLKIYFDDALIVSLLFFLYTEGVKDDMLFIVLLLLLIS